ncbi:fungal-specific transcription factor domain-containing protein [Aspergillus insuetus]
MLLPESPMLLSHYLEDTAPKLAPAPGVPWVSWILPVAYNDDLLMNAILALSGGHLLYKLPDNQEIHHATHRHYSSAVHILYQVLGDGSTLSEPLALLRVALTILILFHYEVVSGNLDGSPFAHLRAARQLVLNLRSESCRSMSAAEQKLYGFVMEVYSYIVLCNSITPFNMNCNRTLIYDSFLQTLDDLQGLGAFGVMFSGGHHLFELISSISLFAAQDAGLDRHQEYRQLKARIRALESPVREKHDDILRPGCSASFEVCRIALLVFLETASSPFFKYDTARMPHLQPLLDVAVLSLPQILPSNYSCILMWPIMIIGSCLMEADQRAVISHMLLHNQYGMKNTAQASMLLDLLWKDSDGYSFGPYGLGLLMDRHNLDYGVI